MLPLAALAADDAGDQTVRLDEVTVTEPRVSAETMAVTDSRLEAVQPMSVISAQTLNNVIAPTADFATIANLAPSVSNVETNGPGLSESKALSIRGFQDAQYNVTYDGIPFGDGNDFSHHTTSYFPAKVLGQVSVDRGPGTAATIGEATFGGTLALSSKDPRPDMAITPFYALGSWKTQLFNLEVNSGVIPQLNGASAIASYQFMSTDGYRTYATMKRNTYYTKELIPLGKNTVITIDLNYNSIKFNNPGANSYATIQAYGRNFGQNANKGDINNYYGYNYQTKQAVMDYFGIEHTFGAGWSLNDKIYTYSYNNDSHESPVANTKSKVTTYAAGAGVSALGDFEGQFKVNGYHAFGDTLDVMHEDSIGTFKTGVWAEYMRNPRYNYFIDYNAAYIAANPGLALPGGVLDKTSAGSPTKGSEPGYAYDMVTYIKNVTPFAEYTWKATSALTIDAGVKDINFTRDLEAPVNQTKDQLPLFFNKTYSKAVGLGSINYRITPEWSSYVQVAQGYLAPNLNWLETDNPTLNNSSPQQTMNYQWGTVYKTNRFNAAFDLYWIDFRHFPFTQQNPNDPNNANDVFYSSAAGAYYYGAELEATYYVGWGTSLYGNVTSNHASFKKSKLEIPGVPDGTAELGVVYDSKFGFFGSVIDKFVGQQVQYSGTVNPDIAATEGFEGRMGGYAITDFTVGYGAKIPNFFLKSYKIRFAINNLFNRDVEVLNSFKGPGSASNTFNPLPMRNYYITFTGDF